MELRVRVVRPGVDGWDRPDRRVGLTLHSAPMQQRGRVWQWVVEVGAGLPALTDLLATCHGFLVDDDCGRVVGVVDDVFVDEGPADPIRLLVVQGWGRQRLVMSGDEVVEVAPGARRLMINCRDGHLRPGTGHTGSQISPFTRIVTSARALLARLAGRA